MDKRKNKDKGTNNNLQHATSTIKDLSMRIRQKHGDELRKGKQFNKIQTKLIDIAKIQYGIRHAR